MERRQYRFRSGPPPPSPQHPDSPPEPEPYVATEELIRAVNLAIDLERPLLLEGEAGSGKTRLARAVAHELGLPFYPWHVRSTSKAEEGFYRYDAIRRLHDAHFSQVGGTKGGAPRDPGDPLQYRELGPLGKAFEMKDRPAVVLIDEIDKAEIDFPNDLLAVLDDPWQFAIPETGEALTATRAALPIVFITSNKEKGNLPLPFLRRCVYFYLQFPATAEALEEIVAAHYRQETVKPPATLVSAAAKRFLKLREEGSLHKNPGTSEFLDWLRALARFGSTPHSANELAAAAPLPYPELLFKLPVDFQRQIAPGA
jgi:MoxR-like ATPase